MSPKGDKKPSGFFGGAMKPISIDKVTKQGETQRSEPKELYRYILKYEAIYEVYDIEEAFFQYLKIERKSNPLEFIRECSKFPKYQKDEKKLFILKKLVNTFIFPNSEKELNISQKSRTKLIMKLTSAGQLETKNWDEKPVWKMADHSLDEIFGEIKQEVLQLLKVEEYTKFMDCPLWKSMEKDYHHNDKVCEKMRIFDVVEQENTEQKWKRKNEQDEKKDKKKLFSFMSKEARKKKLETQLNKPTESDQDRKSLSFLQKISDLGNYIKDSPRKLNEVRNSIAGSSFFQRSNSSANLNPIEKKSSRFQIIKDKILGNNTTAREHNSDSDSDVEEVDMDPKKKDSIYFLIMNQSLLYLHQNGIFTEGIFRKSGSDKLIHQFIKKCQSLFRSVKINKKSKIDFTNERELVRDVHNIAGLVITSLQDLSEPLITFQLYKNFLEAEELKENEKIERLKIVFYDILPRENRETFDLLLSLLYQITVNSSVTLMNPENLAIVFTPLIFKSEETSKNPTLFMEQLPICQNLMKTIIVQFKSIFIENFLTTQTETSSLNQIMEAQRLKKEKEKQLEKEKQASNRVVAIPAPSIVEENLQKSKPQETSSESENEQPKMKIVKKPAKVQKMDSDSDEAPKMKVIKKPIKVDDSDSELEALPTTNEQVDTTTTSPPPKDADIVLPSSIVQKDETPVEKESIMNDIPKNDIPAITVVKTVKIDTSSDEEPIIKKQVQIEPKNEEKFVAKNPLVNDPKKESSSDEETIQKKPIQPTPKKDSSSDEEPVIKKSISKKEISSSDEKPVVTKPIEKQPEIKNQSSSDEEAIKKPVTKKKDSSSDSDEVKKKVLKKKPVKIQDSSDSDDVKPIKKQIKKKDSSSDSEDEKPKKLVKKPVKKVEDSSDSEDEKPKKKPIPKKKVDSSSSEDEKPKTKIVKKPVKRVSSSDSEEEKPKKPKKSIKKESSSSEEDKKPIQKKQKQAKRVESSSDEESIKEKPKIDEKAEKLIEEARIKEQSGMHQPIDLEDEEHEQDTKLASQYLAEGIELVKLKKWEEAVDKFSLAIDYNENLKEAYFNRGLLNYNADRHLNAVMDMYKVISIDPNMNKAYSVRALSLKKLGKFELAIEDFIKSFEKENIVNNYMSVGVCYDKVNKIDEAIESYTKFIELIKQEELSVINRKNLIFVYCNRGLDYCHKNKFSESLEDYTNAIELCKDEDQIREIKALRSKSHKLFGNEEAAKEDLKESLSDVEHYNNGLESVQKKEYDKAHEHFSNAIEMNSSNMNYYFARSVCSKNMKHLDEAIDDLLTCLKIDSESPKVLQSLGKLYQEKGKLSNALKMYSKLIEVSPSSLTYFLRADLLSDIDGKEQEALVDYTSAIKLDDKMYKAYYNRGLIYFHSKKYENAISDFDKAIDIDSSDSNTFVDRGLSYYNLRNVENAVKDFKVAAKKDNERAKNILRDLKIEL